MDELFGLIIFGIIAVVSGLAKLIEKRKEEELRQKGASRQQVDELPEATRKMLYGDGGPHTRADELPEATRRMLYGDGGPPVARRRGEAPPPPVAVPRRSVPPPQRPVPQAREQVPPRRPVPQQAPAPQPQRQAIPPAVPRSAAPQPQRRPQTQQPVYQDGPRSLYEEQQPRRQAPQPQRQPQREVRPAETPAAATEGAPARPQRYRQASARELLRHPKTLRTSILLHEVLSPPKSIRNRMAASQAMRR